MRAFVRSVSHVKVLVASLFGLLWNIASHASDDSSAQGRGLSSATTVYLQAPPQTALPKPEHRPNCRCPSAAHSRDGGQPKIILRREKSFIYKKEPEDPIFCSGQLEPTWRGPVAGGVLIYTHIGGYGFESRCARAFFLLAFGALGRKSQRAQKGELCAAALAEVASLGVGRGSPYFSNSERLYPCASSACLCGSVSYFSIRWVIGRSRLSRFRSSGGLSSV